MNERNAIIPLVGPPTMITATTLSFAATILANWEKLGCPEQLNTREKRRKKVEFQSSEWGHLFVFLEIGVSQRERESNEQNIWKCNVVSFWGALDLDEAVLDLYIRSQVSLSVNIRTWWRNSVNYTSRFVSFISCFFFFFHCFIFFSHRLFLFIWIKRKI